MNEIVITEDISIALEDNDEALDLTLYSDQTVLLEVEDANGGQAKLRLSLDAFRTFHEAAGHILWKSSF